MVYLTPQKQQIPSISLDLNKNLKRITIAVLFICQCHMPVIKDVNRIDRVWALLIKVGLLLL